MNRRCINLLLAFGLLLQGCTIQKRSLMPGWHVERAGGSSAISSPISSEIVADANTATNECLLADTPISQAPPIPLKALMAYSSPFSTTSERQQPRFKGQKIVREFQPCEDVVTDEEPKSDLEPSDEDSSVLLRVFMGMLAITLDLASVPILSLGFWYGGWALLMFTILGVGLLCLSWFAWLAVFPKFRSRLRKKNQWEAKKQRRDEKRQARRNNQWWLKNLSLIVLAVTALLFISLSLWT